jgi:urea transport system substrate-binding protein
MQRRRLIKAFTLTASIVAMGMTWTVQAAETIKVGIQRHGVDDHR